MILLDVNVMVAAFRPDAPRHLEARAWLEQQLLIDGALAVSDVLLSGVVRVCMEPKAWVEPTPPASSLAFAAVLVRHPHVRQLHPGERHWVLFHALTEAYATHTRLVTDCWIAALAMEHRCAIASYDRDFARFPGLAVIRPGEP